MLALIAAHDADAAWVPGLVYAMVAITLASGADHFLNSRRKLEEVTRASASAKGARKLRPKRGARRVGVPEVLDELLTAGAAHVQGPVEELAVDGEHAEQ